MIKFYLGLLIIFMGIFNLVVVVFAYRDFSLQLLTMFFIAIVVYPYGIYLTIKHRPKFEKDSKVDDEKSSIEKMIANHGEEFE